MSIPRYRIGNDLTVLWAINNRDGSPYDLSQKVVRLFVTHPRDRIEVETIVETLPGGEVNNVIRWDFSGLEQRVLGTYMLTAEIYTSEDKKLIRKDISEAFALVSRSEMENEEGGDEVMDGGELYLSSKLDIYRFGIPKIKIGTNGHWFIDNVDTGVSAIGGGEGLVNKIYTYEDFDKSYDPASVIDTFNAYAIQTLDNRIKLLEADDYLQIRNMADVLLKDDLQIGQALVWDGTRWTNKEVAIKSEDNDQLDKLKKLLEWFEFDEEAKMIKAKYGLYSLGAITAKGKSSSTGSGTGGSGSTTLAGLTDVTVTNPTDGQVLMYSVGSGKWINWDKKYTLWGASDVSDAVAEDGQVLVYDKASEMWVPKTIGVGGVTAIDFSLASDANNAITLTINDETQYITAAALKVSLGLGSLAYKNSLAVSDIPPLPWSKITSGKPTTLAGYGIADAYSQTQADARFLKLAGGTLSGTLYTKTIIAENQVFLRMTSGDRFFRSRSIDAAGAVIAEIGFGVGLNGVNRGIYDYTNGRWLLVNYGDGRVVYQGEKFLVKTTEEYVPKDGYTTPIRLGGGVRIDGSLYLPNKEQIKIANKAGDKDMIIFQLNDNNDFLVGQKTAAEGYDTYIYGNALHFKINNGATELLTLTGGGNVGIGKITPACKLDINGELDSMNFVKGGSLASDPTNSFQTAIFGSSDSSFYKMRLMRKGTATDGINAAYSPIFAMKTADTHSFLSISYNTKDKCYIGGGSGDAIIWSSILYHNNMDLIPKYDHSYTIGSASLRYKSLAVSDSVQIGDAIISWDAEAGMLKFDKGLYSTGAVTAGGKGSSNKYRLDNWNEWTVDSDGNVTDAKLLESSLSAKLGVELNKRLAEIEESANIGPVKIDLEYIRSATTLTPQQASTAGLTEDVINNMLAGKYTKVIPDNDAIEVWDYTAYGSGNSISIYLTQGDGFMVKSGIEMRRDSITANWNVIYEEI